MSETANFIFELAVNLFQGTVFTVFCNMFFTPRFNKAINALGCAITTVLLFLSITLINSYFSTFAEIEILVYLIIILPFAICFHKGKLFLKIIMPMIIFVAYMCVAMGYSATISFVFKRDIDLIISQSSVYRYIYVSITNISYLLILYVIQRIYKNKIDLKKPTDIITCFIIPVLTMIIAIICTYIITDSEISEISRIHLGIVAVIAFVIAFSMFPLMEQISKAADVRALNIIMTREQELYKSEISTQNTYIEEISQVKHEMKRKLFCINEFLASGNIEEAQRFCEISEHELCELSPAFRTENIYLNSILNKAYQKARENDISAHFTVKSNLKNLDGSDLLSLLGNLLDNAFDALQKVSGKKFIQATIFEKEHYYIISVKNSVATAILNDNPDLITTKTDKRAHGHGLKIVRSIVGKYNGSISFKEKEGVFDVSLMLEKADSKAQPNNTN